MSLSNNDGELDPNRHQPLIDALTIFYHALAESCYIQPSDIHLPPYGLEFNTSLGLSLGYTLESLELLSKLPYLSESCDNAVQLDGASTTPLTYLTDPNDEDDRGLWEDARDPLYRGDEAPLLPRNIVAVTWGQVYGQWLLYDLNSCTIRSWCTNYSDIPTSADVLVLPPQPPTVLLSEWASRYLSLKTMPLELYGEVFKPDEAEDYGPEWREWIERDFGITRAEYAVDRGLGKIYREFGWRTAEWDRDGFLEKRERWFEAVYEGCEERWTIPRP